MLDQSEINMLLIAVGGVVLAVVFGARTGICSYRRDSHRLKAIIWGIGTGGAWIIATVYALVAYGFSSG